LPSYGAAISERDASLSVQHEAEFQASADAREIASDALALQRFLQKIARTQWRHLQRIVWFRLTLPSDQRALAPRTLQALVQQERLAAAFRAEQRPNAVGGFDVLLQNTGNLDAPIPARVRVQQACSGEGMAGYAFSEGMLLQQKQHVLKAGQKRVIAWVRACS
jgi:hypothetical protein